ncbi:MAG: hypothetical protein ACLP22_20380 [Solirubrobacteraceae bacterium]
MRGRDSVTCKSAAGVGDVRPGAGGRRPSWPGRSGHPWNAVWALWPQKTFCCVFVQRPRMLRNSSPVCLVVHALIVFVAVLAVFEAIA